MNSFSKLSFPLFIAGGLSAIAYAGLCLALYNIQTRLIFRPLPFLFLNPAKEGVPYEDVHIPLSQTDSNSKPIKLHGWWMPNHHHNDALIGSDRVLLLCHGNYGNISYNVKRCRFYRNLGFSVLSFDYRGYGLSPGGEPSEQKTYEDAEAALQYLITERQIAPEKITVLGHSLGGAIALNLAVKHPELNSLIVECSFTSMKEAVHAKKIYRFFPVEQLLNHAFDSLSKVEDLRIPVLYVHGDADVDVPPIFSQQLYDASPEPKRLWIASGAGHDNITADFSETYAETIQSFLGKTNSLTQQNHISSTQSSDAQLEFEPINQNSLPKNLEQEVRTGRKFSLAEAIGREGSDFMKGESAIPRPLKAIVTINRFITTHLLDANGALSTTLQSWAQEDIRVSRHLDDPLTALTQIVEGLINEPATFQEFFRQVAIAQSKLTGDRPYFQKVGHSPHPAAQYSHASVKSQLSTLLQLLSKIDATKIDATNTKT